MSLSDYISIFDTRPIAQSHLFEAATATLGAIYTGYMSIYTTHTNAHALQIVAKHEQRVYTASSCTARHGKHATPNHAKPRHTTLQGPSYVARGVRWRWCRRCHRCRSLPLSWVYARACTRTPS